jgi:hypothetical protein
MTERTEQNLYRAVWALIAFTVLYLGAHVVVAGFRGNLGAHDPYPGCEAACHDLGAAEAVQEASAATGRVCWADDADNARGYVVTCR